MQRTLLEESGSDHLIPSHFNTRGNNSMLVVREAAPEKLHPLFGHCPNSNRTLTRTLTQTGTF